jgi:hypothetical protein
MIIIIYYVETGEEKHLVNLHKKSGAVATAKRLVDLRPVRSQGGSRAPVPANTGLSAERAGWRTRLATSLGCQ